MGKNVRNVNVILIYVGRSAFIAQDCHGIAASRWLGRSDGGALAMRVYGHLRDVQIGRFITNLFQAFLLADLFFRRHHDAP